MLTLEYLSKARAEAAKKGRVIYGMQMSPESFAYLKEHLKEQATNAFGLSTDFCEGDALPVIYGITVLVDKEWAASPHPSAFIYYDGELFASACRRVRARDAGHPSL